MHTQNLLHFGSVDAGEGFDLPLYFIVYLQALKRNPGHIVVKWKLPLTIFLL